MTVEVRDGDVWLDGARVELERAVTMAGRLADGSIVVLFDLVSGASTSWRSSSNLISIDEQGHTRWIAAPPDTHADAYIAIVSTDPLVAQSFSGYGCTLDPNTGQITHRVFTT